MTSTFAMRTALRPLLTTWLSAFTVVVSAHISAAPAHPALNDGKTVNATVAPASAVVPNESHHGGISVSPTGWPVALSGVDRPLLSLTKPSGDPWGVPSSPLEGDWEHDGAFRLQCNWTHMSFDDPIAFPGMPGAAHHHTFFGNSAVDAFTTPGNIRSKGSASCRGGTINLSGYWVPSMIDTATGNPLAPQGLIIYYKTGAWTYMNNGSLIQPLPKGLRMIAGNSTAFNATSALGGFHCMTSDGNSTLRAGTAGKAIPTCTAGETLRATIDFPQCWDGVNLDSADHKSHMARPKPVSSNNPKTQARCPDSHPVVLPLITFHVDFLVPLGANTSKWRLASDMYGTTTPGGYSMHGDWMNGWDPAISDLWGAKCMQERRDCGSANLGDGRVTQEFQGN